VAGPRRVFAPAHSALTTATNTRPRLLTPHALDTDQQGFDLASAAAPNGKSIESSLCPSPHRNMVHAFEATDDGGSLLHDAAAHKPLLLEALGLSHDYARSGAVADVARRANLFCAAASDQPGLYGPRVHLDAAGRILPAFSIDGAINLEMQDTVGKALRK
jgi:hypothetical protein